MTDQKQLVEPAIVQDEEKEKLKATVISYVHGREDILQDDMLRFFLTDPQIIYSSNWTGGIVTTFLFIHR